MVTDREDMADTDLDMLLDDMARLNADPSPELLGRVLDDALAMQPLPHVHDSPNVVSIFGGWTGLSGLAAAACAGFFIGFSPPAMIQDPVSLLLGDEISMLDTDASISGFGWDLEEDVPG